RQDACSTKSEFSCGTGILPVPKKLIDNDATSQIELLNIKPRIPPSQRKRDSKLRKVLRGFFGRYQTQ
ncbi:MULTISPECIES: hypothetical protein, partial [unclassified Microcoleus]|uniref:hypothetical protein n=1 Tax=unclassified Microcoleus TaxID=2642155 RepID=UPI002FD6F24F